MFICIAQLKFIWFIGNLIIITEDLFDDIQIIINSRVAYLNISSVRYSHRYNRFN